MAVKQVWRAVIVPESGLRDVKLAAIPRDDRAYRCIRSDKLLREAYAHALHMRGGRKLPRIQKVGLITPASARRTTTF